MGTVHSPVRSSHPWVRFTLRSGAVIRGYGSLSGQEQSSVVTVHSPVRSSHPWVRFTLRSGAVTPVYSLFTEHIIFYTQLNLSSLIQLIFYPTPLNLSRLSKIAINILQNVVNLYVRFSCMCIYCLYLRRRQKSLNHSAIHLTCLYIYLHPVLYMYMSYVVNLYVCLSCMYVLYCMYLSWRHGRTAPWPSCLSRLKNLIKKKIIIKKKVLQREE